MKEDLPATIATIKRELAPRKIIAAEMEVDAFHKTLAESGILFLAVKGVCDFGDQWKDDAYHDVAAEYAAAVILDLVSDIGATTVDDEYGGNEDDEADEDEKKRPAKKAKPSLLPPLQIDVETDVLLKQLVAELQQLEAKQSQYTDAATKLHQQLEQHPMHVEWKKPKQELRQAAHLPEDCSKQLPTVAQRLGERLRISHPSTLRFRLLSERSAVVTVEGSKSGRELGKPFLRDALGVKRANALMADCIHQRDVKWTVNGVLANAANHGRADVVDPASLGPDENLYSRISHT